MHVRKEGSNEARTIFDLAQQAFSSMPYSNGSEGPIIDGLRQDGDLTLSLVADDGGVIVGHIAFSPVWINGKHDDWFGLGPVAVSPERQKQGIGRMLIQEGLHQMRHLGAHGCLLVGAPALYQRFGFVSEGQLTYGSLDRELIQHMVFHGSPPQGDVTFAPAFERSLNA